MSVSDEVLKRFATLATPTLANALDDVAFEGVLAGLTQMVPGTRCVGRAVTVREITGSRGDFTSEDFKVGDMIDAARAGRHPRHRQRRALRLDLRRAGDAGRQAQGHRRPGGRRRRARPRGDAGAPVPRVRAPHDAAHRAHAARRHRHQRARDLRRRARAAGRCHRRRRLGRGVHPRRACGQGRRAGRELQPGRRAGRRRARARASPSARRWPSSGASEPHRRQRAGAR